MFPWYKEGLRFTCTECGDCCREPENYVFLSRTDVQKLCAFLQLKEKVFFQKFTRIVQRKIVLINKAESDACIFLKENHCSVYPARPIQCATGPWWPMHLQSKKTWEKAAKLCEGINDEKALTVSKKIIDQELFRYMANIVDMEVISK